MTITVDKPTQFGNKFCCHLIADTDSELERIAKRLKLRIKQVGLDKGCVKHLDLPNEHKRELALRYGAREDEP